MNVTLSRKFQVAPYEMHEIIVSVSESDLDIPSDQLKTTMENLVELRNLATKMVMAELYIYGALPAKEKIDAIYFRADKAQNALLKKNGEIEE